MSDLLCALANSKSASCYNRNDLTHGRYESVVHKVRAQCRMQYHSFAKRSVLAFADDFQLLRVRTSERVVKQVENSVLGVHAAADYYHSNPAQCHVVSIAGCAVISRHDYLHVDNAMFCNSVVLLTTCPA